MTDTVTQKKELQEAALTTLAPKPAPFEKLNFQPPRLDQFGYNAEPKQGAKPEAHNILNEKPIAQPEWWGSNGCGNKTKTEMLAKRHAALRPDISYDLDGDGIVGNRDYVISKLFDTKGNGKLDAQERRNADEAIKNVSQSIHQSINLNNVLIFS
jgi:hypothetical protein